MSSFLPGTGSIDGRGPGSVLRPHAPVPAEGACSAGSWLEPATRAGLTVALDTVADATAEVCLPRWIVWFSQPAESTRSIAINSTLRRRCPVGVTADTWIQLPKP